MCFQVFQQPEGLFAVAVEQQGRGEMNALLAAMRLHELLHIFAQPIGVELAGLFNTAGDQAYEHHLEREFLLE